MNCRFTWIIAIEFPFVLIDQTLIEVEVAGVAVVLAIDSLGLDPEFLHEYRELSPGDDFLEELTKQPQLKP